MIHLQLTEKSLEDKNRLMAYQETNLQTEIALLNRKALNTLRCSLTRLPKYYKIAAAMHGYLGLFIRPSSYGDMYGDIFARMHARTRERLYKGAFWDIRSANHVDIVTSISLKFPYSINIQVGDYSHYGDMLTPDMHIWRNISSMDYHLKNFSTMSVSEHELNIPKSRIPIEHPLSKEDAFNDLAERF
tara:strand:+ start:3163 stop:3726 length:564 start_codon:yes stop_codon:yes gene_type:complete